MTASESDRGGHGGAAALLALAVAGLLLVFAGLTLSASLVGLAVAAPPLLLSSPVLVTAALLACLLATGAAASAALALGALSILSCLRRKAAGLSDHDCIADGKRRVAALAEVAGNRTPHAALAVVSQQGITDHKKAKHYQHYVAGRMVQDDA